MTEETKKDYANINVTYGIQAKEGLTEEERNAVLNVIKVLKAKPCEDCVSREAVKKLYCNICMDKNICYRNKENCEELILFDKLPPVTPKPRTGKWIDKKPNLQSPFAKMYWCDQCGAHAYKSAYCPGCGAKMEGEEG